MRDCPDLQIKMQCGHSFNQIHWRGRNPHSWAPFPYLFHSLSLSWILLHDFINSILLGVLRTPSGLMYLFIYLALSYFNSQLH